MKEQLILTYATTLIFMVLRIWYLKRNFKCNIYESFERSLVDSLIIGLIAAIVFSIIIPYTH